MIYVIVTLAAAGAILGTLWMMAVKNNIEELKKRVLSLEKPIVTLKDFTCTFENGPFRAPKITKKPSKKDEFWSKGFAEYIYGKPKHKEKTIDLPTAMKWAKKNVEDFMDDYWQKSHKDGGFLVKNVPRAKSDCTFSNKEWCIYHETMIEKACLRFVNEVLTKHLK